MTRRTGEVLYFLIVSEEINIFLERSLYGTRLTGHAVACYEIYASSFDESATTSRRTLF